MTLEKEDMTIVATSNPSKNAVHQLFYTRNAFSGLAVEGLEPTSKNTGFGFTAGESGNPGGNFQSIFANLLHSEYGFSADDVVKILQAAERAAVKLNDVRNWVK